MSICYELNIYKGIIVPFCTVNFNFLKNFVVKFVVIFNKYLNKIVSGSLDYLLVLFIVMKVQDFKICFSYLLLVVFIFMLDFWASLRSCHNLKLISKFYFIIHLEMYSLILACLNPGHSSISPILFLWLRNLYILC